MTTDNNTGKSKEFYERGQQMFDRIKPLNERSQTKPSSKRTWVGLTDEEIWSTVGRIGTADSDVNPYQILNDARSIEAKLKDKNT